MKNINVQREVEYHQNNEKIEDLRMILESCARNAGLPIGFSAVITRAGVAVPLPLLPPRPLPRPGRLGSVDESTHQILSYGLLFLTFYHFLYTAGPPTSTTLARPSPTIARRFVRSLLTMPYTHCTIGPVPHQRPLI